MKLAWLAQRGAPCLLVFFNGWGMDQRVVAGMPAPPECDLLEVHDYADLDPAEFAGVLPRYASVSLAAWSLGVWAAAAVFSRLPRAPEHAVAINGTCRPVDGEHGIPPDLFRATAERFGAAGCASFERRMCGGAEALAHFRARPPRRALEDRGAELRALASLVAADPAPRSIFTRAVVGLRDRIVPPGNQVRFWDGTAPHVPLDLPHYPFLHLGSWDAILGRAADR